MRRRRDVTRVTPPRQQRVGSERVPVGDHWFTFGPRNYEPDADIVRPRERYDPPATEVMRFVDEQAKPWWHEQLRARSA